MGRVERVHRILNEKFRIWKGNPKVRTWKDLLPYLEMAHNFTVMPQCNMSPSQINFGTHPRFPFQNPRLRGGGKPSQALMMVRELHRRLAKLQREFWSGQGRPAAGGHRLGVYERHQAQV